MDNQTHRIGEIIELLKLRGYLSQKDIAQELMVSRKTIERDMQFMRRSLRAPLAYDESKKGWYLIEDFKVSLNFEPIFVSNDEYNALLVIAALIAQHAHTPVGKNLKSIFEKLAGIFQTKKNLRKSKLSQKICFADLPAAPANKAVWPVILKALRDEKGVELVRKKSEGSAGAGLYEPYGLIARGGAWYLAAKSRPGNRPRALKLASIQKAILHTEIEVETPKDFELEKFSRSAF